MRTTPALFLLTTPLLLCMCLCDHVFVVSRFCLEDQQSLLLQLKNQLKFDSEESSKLVSWNPLLPCCEWRGVTCDEEGHVTGLDLSLEYIHEGLDNSSALFSLQYLQNLDLRHNFFNSLIPPAIKILKNLTSLDLSDAGFTGQIPIEISQLTRLVTLDLSSYENFGIRITNLQKLVQNLTGMRQLHLDHVIISAQGQEWSNALLAFPGLEELSMSGCDLSRPIDSSLTRLENLSVIVLDENELSSTVPEAFSNFKHLTTLGLSDCNLRGIFPQKIFQIATLSLIDISYNEDLRGSLPDLPLNGSLKTLRHLSYMDLSHCLLSGMLPSSLSNATKLTYLDLSSNSFFGPIPSFVLLKNLTYVDLSHNNLSGAISSNHFEAPQNLVHLDLSNNSISGSIPSSLFALSSLQEIHLSFNHF